MIGGLTGIGAVAQQNPLGGSEFASPSASQSAPGASVADSFAAALAEAAGRAADTLNNAEKMSVAGLQGQADARSVVDAVMSAEQTLQAAVAIRDKIVAAYLEISRMGI